LRGVQQFREYRAAIFVRKEGVLASLHAAACEEERR
jgi:hypothetical protein